MLAHTFSLLHEEVDLFYSLENNGRTQGYPSPEKLLRVRLHCWSDPCSGHSNTSPNNILQAGAICV